jgi:NSS family neurotransmitter:Na+ symporter
MKKASSEEELGAGLMHRIWLFVLRYQTPVGLVVLFLYNL